MCEVDNGKINALANSEAEYSNEGLTLKTLTSQTRFGG